MIRDMSLGISRCCRDFFFIVLVGLIFFAGFCSAQDETILANFVVFPQGANPESNLTADVAGNLYGTALWGGKYGGGIVFKLMPGTNGKWTESVIYDFQGGNDGAEPAAGLIFDASGNLYGTTSSGGSGCAFSLCGTVFKLSPGAHGIWTESVLYNFTGYPNDGQNPVASLVLDAAGNLYGTTEEGGTYEDGTVFELSPGSNGTWAESILHNFSGGTDGASPLASLILDSKGNLYSTTEYGGDVNCNGPRNITSCGVVFELTAQGNGTWNENVLHTFEFTDGGYPAGGLVFDSAGNLHGTTTEGPVGGTVFRLHPESNGTWVQTILFTFQGGADGAYPASGLIFGKHGQLYGTTRYGGSPELAGSGCGTVFELTPRSKGAWKEHIIHRFFGLGAFSGCQLPLASLLLDSRGTLFGTTPFGGNMGGFCTTQQYSDGCGTVFGLRKESGGKWGFDLLYAFPPGRLGISPAAGLVADDQGSFYGMAESGGWNTCFASSGSGCGTVFKVTPHGHGQWETKVLYNFEGGTDGATPHSSLIRDGSGNLYGTTWSGGVAGCIGLYVACGGTVYELSPTADGWKESVLHRFHPGAGGVTPIAGLVMDAEGNLYGAASAGGNKTGCDLGCGTIFKLSPSGDGDWKQELLYVFEGGADGAGPLGTLIFDDEGSLYGTTCSGGATGAGTVFRLTPSSEGAWNKAILHSFRGSPNDGFCPWGGVTADGNGNLFGTTYQGGVNTGNCAYSGCGVVFELSPVASQWKETVLLKFDGTDGASPVSALSMDEAGNLYGAAPYSRGEGGEGGTVFELSPGSKGWNKHILHRFGSKGDGSNPNGPLIFDQGKNIYGTTAIGGFSAGTVFELSHGDFEW